jgi:hypothetical protein
MRSGVCRWFRGGSEPLRTGEMLQVGCAQARRLCYKSIFVVQASRLSQLYSYLYSPGVSPVPIVPLGYYSVFQSSAVHFSLPRIRDRKTR